MNPIYCPECGEELPVREVEAVSSNLFVECHVYRCPAKGIEIKLDPQGFVILPLKYSNRYVFTRKLQVKK